MSLRDFIFSEKKITRILRHVIFWLACWLYFTLTFNYFLQVGHHKLDFGELGSIRMLQTLMLVLMHMTACYFFIYYVLPEFLLKRKYVLLTAGVFAVASFLLLVCYFFHQFIFPGLDATHHLKIAESNNTIWWTTINSGLLMGPKIIAPAVGIKLVKRWRLKQKEKERVEKEKLITDLQLMKAQIRPDFLFSSLDQIYEAARKNSVEAPELLIRLSDLLSYLLYECEEAKVPLEKELNMMKEYMALEKNRYNERLELEIILKGNLQEKNIAPLILLPFIETSFKNCDKQTELPWINLEISVDNEILSMKLLTGADTETDYSIDNVKNIEKRLELLYPEKHELKRYVEQEIHFVLLKIDLSTDKEHTVKRINATELKKGYAYN